MAAPGRRSSAGQSAGLITRRSVVRAHPPLLTQVSHTGKSGQRSSRGGRLQGLPARARLTGAVSSIRTATRFTTTPLTLSTAYQRPRASGAAEASDESIVAVAGLVTAPTNFRLGVRQTILTLPPLRQSQEVEANPERLLRRLDRRRARPALGQADRRFVDDSFGRSLRARPGFRARPHSDCRSSPRGGGRSSPARFEVRRVSCLGERSASRRQDVPLRLDRRALPELGNHVRGARHREREADLPLEPAVVPASP